MCHLIKTSFLLVLVGEVIELEALIILRFFSC